MQVVNNPNLEVLEGGEEVAVDSWCYSQGGVLVARDVSSFAVAVVLNEETDEGYLGYFSGQPLKDNEHFKSYIAVLQEQQHGARLSIWLGGIATFHTPSVHPETLEIYNEQARQDMMQLADAVLNLQEISDDEIHTTWLGVNKEIVVAQLDCRAGLFEYTLRTIDPSEFGALAK